MSFLSSLSPPLLLGNFEALSLLASNSALHLLSVCHTISINGPGRGDLEVCRFKNNCRTSWPNFAPLRQRNAAAVTVTPESPEAGFALQVDESMFWTLCPWRGRLMTKICWSIQPCSTLTKVGAPGLPGMPDPLLNRQRVSNKRSPHKLLTMCFGFFEEEIWTSEHPHLVGNGSARSLLIYLMNWTKKRRTPSRRATNMPPWTQDFATRMPFEKGIYILYIYIQCGGDLWGLFRTLVTSTYIHPSLTVVDRYLHVSTSFLPLFTSFHFISNLFHFISLRFTSFQNCFTSFHFVSLYFKFASFHFTLF